MHRQAMFLSLDGTAVTEECVCLLLIVKQTVLMYVRRSAIVQKLSSDRSSLRLMTVNKRLCITLSTSNTSTNNQFVPDAYVYAYMYYRVTFARKDCCIVCIVIFNTGLDIYKFRQTHLIGLLF